MQCFVMYQVCNCEVVEALEKVFWGYSAVKVHVFLAYSLHCVEQSLLISIGNHMDDSAIWEKIAWEQENCTWQSRVLFELL